MDIHDHEFSTSCLSVDPHDDNITDPVLHYFGCLEASERSSFFDPAAPYWAGEVEKRMKAGSTRHLAESEISIKIKTWETRCSDEIHRLSQMLSAIADNPTQSHLLRNVAKSRDAWRASRDYGSGIQRVRKWRAGRGMKNGVFTEPLPVPTGDVYNPDRLRISIMAFRRGTAHDLDHFHVTRTFPNQNIAANDLLRPGADEDFGLLKSIRDSDIPGVTWFHIPANNMTWVEEAIACYYGEKRPSRDQIRQKDKASKAVRILRDFFWRGQQYGDPAKPDSRFMRPFCQSISPGLRHAESGGENLVLFAPFLHWDTSRHMDLLSRKIKASKVSNASDLRRKTYLERQERERKRAGLNGSHRPYLGHLELGVHMAQQRLMFKSELTAFPNLHQALINPEDTHHQSRNPLAQYLLNAARLYEELRAHEDSSLIQKYLFTDPPIHPRRTLKQGHYATLNSIVSRGQSQVVYQATTTLATSAHWIDESTGEWKCAVHRFSFGECPECLANIRKVSKVVVVDQLWMWVLDQKTIITCFPKRYGVHGHDPSGVFEAVQQRLSGDRTVHSVFEVTRTILDECSRTFDRMKDSSGQPPVLDIFSEAIHDVSRRQRLETQRLWEWINHARRINRQQGPRGDAHWPAWTLSTEGSLDREIQNIIQELEIMILVNRTQLSVYTKFMRHASNIINDGPKVRPGEDETDEVGAESQLGAVELTAKVNDRIENLESLLKAASNVSGLVKDLSQLRQQQDSVIQAMESVKLSLDSMDQGRTVMVFTVVTIIFSPLSFLSSIFGMNNAEFGDNQWKVSDQLRLILPISVGVTAVALVFASRRVRSVVIYTARNLHYRRLLAALRLAIRLLSALKNDFMRWITKPAEKTPKRSPAQPSLPPAV
ncbi:hypothetical protein F4777DRAFT_166920 [Nemania sp. FL0916]|nr:hypothetical protein F4777DRAFT_166920 [Nemania sp. FL0916]